MTGIGSYADPKVVMTFAESFRERRQQVRLSLRLDLAPKGGRAGQIPQIPRIRIR